MTDYFDGHDRKGAVSISDQVPQCAIDLIKRFEGYKKKLPDGSANFQSITKVCDSPELWPDSKWVKEQFVKYRDPGTPVEEGLRRRREAEAELFCTPV